MGKASRKKGSVRVKPRKSGSMAFGVIITAIVIAGVAGIALSRSSGSPANQSGPGIGDHWHAALGVNVCGSWKPNTPQYESPTGIHSHGDGFIHMHPFSRAGANQNATVGLFLKQAGEKVSDREIKLADGTDMKNGEVCKNLDNQKGKVRWSVNGKERTGDPAEFVAKDRDVVALAFLPDGTDIGTPPVARGGAVPSDVPGAQPQVPITPTPPDSTPSPEATTPSPAPPSTGR
jgi:hypothetical protein